MDNCTQVLVIDKDKERATQILERLQNICEDFNRQGKKGYRLVGSFDIRFDYALVNYDDKWTVESIRTSEKRLKWEYKLARGFIGENE